MLAGWLGAGLVVLGVLGGCGKSRAKSDGGSGAGGGGAGGVSVGGAGDVGGAGGRDAAMPDAVGSGGTNTDGSPPDHPADAPLPDASGDVSRDGPRPTPKLTFTLMTPGWDADVIAGAANGEIWSGSKPSSVLQIHADGTLSTSSLALLGSAYVTGLWVAGLDNVYASAYANLVLHWDGSGTWKRDILTSGRVFEGIWGSSPTDVYALAGGEVYHSGGDDQWTVQTVRQTTIAGFASITGTSPTDLWVLGKYGEVFRSVGDGIWSLEMNPNIQYGVQIWAASSDEAYFVTSATIMRRLPSTGLWVTEPTPLGSTDYFHCIWGSGPSDVYAGTNQAHLFHSIGDGVWQDEGFDPGTSFLPAIKGIWGRSASDVYLGTSNGIYHGVP
ncbi:MAG TPA: hypothetical protein VIF57_05785 [Polyangia bacterium]